MDTCVITFNGQQYKVKAGTCAGDFLRDHGFSGFVCGGHGKCGKCRAVFSGNVSEITASERTLLSAEDLSRGVRLACRTFFCGDCTVAVETTGGAVIRTDGTMPELVLAPLFGTFGAAVDIGTTTVALRLYDAKGKLKAEKSTLNPQRRFGADVISRMGSALSGKGEIISEAIRDCICSLMRSAALEANVDAAAIDGAVITGNTVMLHFLTGTDVEPLTHAPFAVRRLFGERLDAGKLGLSVLEKNTPVYLPRCASAFVGADITTALIASQVDLHTGTSVLTDVGTNGETVLIRNGKLLACSSAAGPAFEGAGISCGMGGSVGAIDKVEVNDDGTLTCRVIGNAAPAGICGSGIIDAVAALLKTGRLDETGCLEEGDVTLAPNVVITQRDVREVQLAKSAICAGIRTLLHVSDLTCKDVDTLYIAGGFGSYLDISSAAATGLIPAELSDRVKVLGNAALAGASAILLSSPLADASLELAEKIQTVRLASNPVFVKEYTNGMIFNAYDL